MYNCNSSLIISDDLKNIIKNMSSNKKLIFDNSKLPDKNRLSYFHKINKSNKINKLINSNKHNGFKNFKIL